MLVDYSRERLLIGGLIFDHIELNTTHSTFEYNKKQRRRNTELFQFVFVFFKYKQEREREKIHDDDNQKF